MKRCPECRRDYYDDTLLYCLDDGSELLEGPPSADEHATAVLPDVEVEAATRVFSQSDNGNSGKDATKAIGLRNGLFATNRRLLIAGVVAVALIAVCSFGFYYLYESDGDQIRSLAVLPFENGIGDAEMDYLSDGMSESLIDRLSQLSNLKVIARSSSFKHRGPDVDIMDVADKLGVRALIMGRISREGDSLTVRVELIDARDNKQIWGEQFSRQAADIVSIDQEIARTVVERLRPRLSGIAEIPAETKQRPSPKAFEYFLKGNFYIDRIGPESLKTANKFYLQAIIEEPEFAPAHARLSRSYILLASTSAMDPHEALPKARDAAQQAIRLDENLPDAHIGLAAIYMNEWKWASAENEFKRAIELNPNLSDARERYSYFLNMIGRPDEAVIEAKRARDLDPLSVSTNDNLGYQLFFARRYDEAESALKKTIELDPSASAPYVCLGYTAAARGRHDEAIEWYRNAAGRGDTTPSTKIYLGASYARSGDRDMAKQILLELRSGNDYFSSGELAVLLAALDEKDAAFFSLEKAFSEHDLQLQFLKVDPALDPLRSDPRFADLVKRVGFP
ncbi:MAG: tetratricopeptide repeat protein [Pyrinomonadaceae bacterium]